LFESAYTVHVMFLIYYKELAQESIVCVQTTLNHVVCI